ncbi:MAG: response regulator [Patescibacteria group bacterium]|jgi:DNA-binding response OmpR family regulator
MAKILVFDVNPARLMGLCAALAPHQVVSAGNILQAVQEAVLSHPDLIISDWDDSDGVKLVQELWRVPNFTPPPVCFTDTTHGPRYTKKLRLAALRRGAYGFIPRPLSHAGLACLVNALLGKIRLHGYPCGPVGPTERQELVEGDPILMTVRILSEPARLPEHTARVRRLVAYPSKLRLVTFEEGEWPKQSSN